MKSLIQTYLDSLEDRKRTIDQLFLRDYVYATVAQSVTVHDNKQLDINSRPFPTYNLSDIEKTPYFHIGMIDAGAQQTITTITDDDATQVRWNLHDENDDIICSYNTNVRANRTIAPELPYVYSQKIDEEKWYITVTTFTHQEQVT